VIAARFGKGDSASSATERIEIGNDIWTGHYVYVTDQNHGYENVDLPIGTQMWHNEPVSIGRRQLARSRRGRAARFEDRSQRRDRRGARSSPAIESGPTTRLSPACPRAGVDPPLRPTEFGRAW